MQIYNISVVNMTESGQVIVMDNCNGFTFANNGTSIVYVNDMPLYPGTPGTNLGDAWEVGGNAGEVYKGLIQVRFDTGGINNLIVVQKNYVL